MLFLSNFIIFLYVNFSLTHRRVTQDPRVSLRASVAKYHGSRRGGWVFTLLTPNPAHCHHTTALALAGRWHRRRISRMPHASWPFDSHPSLSSLVSSSLHRAIGDRGNGASFLCLETMPAQIAQRHLPTQLWHPAQYQAPRR